MQSLTPVNVIKHAQMKGQMTITKSRKTSIEANSLGGLHHLKDNRKIELMQT
jgi:hypothetical protein